MVRFGVSGYWREEFSLIAVLLLFFAGIVVFSFRNPFDARLFPLVIGTAGILLARRHRRRADPPATRRRRRRG